MVKLTNKEYDALDGLRSTDVRRILENPYGYKINKKLSNRASLDIGSYAHAILLEPNTIDKDFTIYEKGKGSTEAVKAIRELGLTPISKDDAINIENAISALKKTEAYSLFNNCKFEMSFIKEYQDVMLKCKTDAVNENLIIDFKTTSTQGGASPSSFIKSCANYGYHIQAAHYIAVTEIQRFVFVVLELVEPYMVGVYTLDSVSLDFGLDKVKEAIEIYKNLYKFKNNLYIDTQDYSKIKTLTLPNWVYYQ
ncbi:PD-(D/E)XK nuclease-like domain-containing protein [Helicobacter sp. MIT 05-5294]|uniref:PD-(D/E)XK nuclease-like domain-containing protein n=1 Tax=Helicobacter sp. MIT 05-5294 TaxID=1548150 RepID=UPI00051FABF2|nr:PD-(D/E)XK nuclease-like domain-containing protein [Helicobacter sp. MIT 05-5294]TLD85803.1 hypothetical protein LS69_007865 [Helicobacter sp. MIT 05-5294]